MKSDRPSIYAKAVLNILISLPIALCHLERYAAMADPPTSTVTADCTGTLTMTIYAETTTTTTISPSRYITSAPPSACTGTSADCPCASGYSCSAIGTCTWACVASPSPQSSNLAASTSLLTQPTDSASTISAVTSLSTSTSVPVQYTSSTSTQNPSFLPITATSTAPSTSSTSTSQNGPGFADGDPDSYLPCVPGTFICTNATEFYTCDYNDGSNSEEPQSTYVYDYPREDAAGMECLPNLSPYSNETQQYAQQGQTEAGYFRDDRYVRSTPDGSCDDEGAIQCTDGGQQFDVCDQGGWIQMGSVANGTMCEDGQIVAGE